MDCRQHIDSTRCRPPAYLPPRHAALHHYNALPLVGVPGRLLSRGSLNRRCPRHDQPTAKTRRAAGALSDGPGGGRWRTCVDKQYRRRQSRPHALGLEYGSDARVTRNHDCRPGTSRCQRCRRCVGMCLEHRRPSPAARHLRCYRLGATPFFLANPTGRLIGGIGRAKKYHCRSPTQL